jgi:hypothetical protein
MYTEKFHFHHEEASYRKFHVVVAFTRTNRTMNKELVCPSCISNIELWVTTCPYLIHVADNVPRWGLHLQLVQMTRATAVATAERPLQVNNLSLEIINNSHRKGPRRATTLSLQTVTCYSTTSIKLSKHSHCITATHTLQQSRLAAPWHF